MCIRDRDAVTGFNHIVNADRARQMLDLGAVGPVSATLPYLRAASWSGRLLLCHRSVLQPGQEQQV
eukprot:9320065-Alexandrium_andersonii.AAC.1